MNSVFPPREVWPSGRTGTDDRPHWLASSEPMNWRSFRVRTFPRLQSNLKVPLSSLQPFFFSFFFVSDCCLLGPCPTSDITYIHAIPLIVCIPSTFSCLDLNMGKRKPYQYEAGSHVERSRSRHPELVTIVSTAQATNNPRMMGHQQLSIRRW